MKWFKPIRNQFKIFYKAGEGYEPDFVVESATARYPCEPKRVDEEETWWAPAVVVAMIGQFMVLLLLAMSLIAVPPGKPSAGRGGRGRVSPLFVATVGGFCLALTGIAAVGGQYEARTSTTLTASAVGLEARRVTPFGTRRRGPWSREQIHAIRVASHPTRHGQRRVIEAVVHPKGPPEDSVDLASEPRFVRLLGDEGGLSDDEKSELAELLRRVLGVPDDPKGKAWPA